MNTTDRFLITFIFFVVGLIILCIWGPAFLVPSYNFILKFFSLYGRGIGALGLLGFMGLLGLKAIRVNAVAAENSIGKVSDGYVASVQKLVTEGENQRRELARTIARLGQANGELELLKQQLSEARTRLSTLSIDNDAFKAEIERLKKLISVSVPQPSLEQQSSHAKLQAMAEDVVGHEVA